MPYIHKGDRKLFDHIKSAIDFFPPRNAGELNYLITLLTHSFLGEKPNYERYNAAIGALESAKLELYRRKIAEYEEIKIKANGDV